MKYAAECRALTREAYEICDKLGLVQPLSWNESVAYAITSFALADYQAEDGLVPDLELIKKSERLWEQARRESPDNPMVKGNIVVVRRRLADELTDRGRRDEAARWQRKSLDTARGNPELLYLLAIEYAQNAALTGKFPTKLKCGPAPRHRRRFEADAVAMLRQAADDGFKDAARLRGESSFGTVPFPPDFAAILADIEFPAQPFESR